ncbi:MAG: alpha/beta hydrolase, partial [Fibrobacteraceae bacterium]|nr:alpha/beta hydrolase [Fibrobacteraceae bacterium]
FLNCSEATDKVNSAISDAENQLQDQIGNLPVDSLNPDVNIDPNQPIVTPDNPENPLDSTTILIPPAPDSSSNPNVGDILESSSSEMLVPESSSSETVVEEPSSSSVAEEGGIFLANGTNENGDEMEVEYITNTGWDGGGILAHPKRLSETKKHAVVMWGPGGGTEPGAYGGMIRRLASHGFVVIALRESPGDASQGKKALDWLENKNNTPGDALYGKLDMTKVGCSGHSMGGLESEQMLIKDSRVITALLNNSGDLGHSAMAQVSTNKTIAIVYGEGGMERPNAEADYHNNGVKAPACLIKMTGGNGTECYNGECGWGHGSGAWDGIPATVAWMRWHLGGEDFRKADFVGTTGKYIDGPIYVANGTQGRWNGQCKNF